jgi:hypothetical protein
MIAKQTGMVPVSDALNKAFSAAAAPTNIQHRHFLALNDATPPLFIKPPVFTELHASVLAARMQQSPHSHYMWLVEMRQRVDTYPNDPGRMLRMQVIEGKSREQIAEHFKTNIKNVDPAISTALKHIMNDVEIPMDRDLRRQLVHHLKRFEVQRNLYPWHAWFDLWKKFPADVATPPPIHGLLHEEIWEPMKLGKTQADRGHAHTQSETPSAKGLPKLAERPRFTVEPFIQDGFIGLRIIPDCTASTTVRPTKALAIGVHADLTHRDHNDRMGAVEREKNCYCPATSREDFDTKGKTPALLFKVPNPDSTAERVFRDAYSARGALTLLTFGYGPIDLDKLFEKRPIYQTTRLENGKCSVTRQSTLEMFATGITEEPPAALSLPPQLMREGFTSYTFRFPEKALRVLMKNKDLRDAQITILAQRPNAGDIAEVVATLSFNDITPNKIDFSIRGFGKWHNTNLPWVRTTEVCPALTKLLETGEGFLPRIDPIKIPKLVQPKNHRSVRFANNFFPIPDNYSESHISLEVYLHKGESGASDRVIATFFPVENSKNPGRDNPPIVVFATDVGVVQEGQKRKWSQITNKQWLIMNETPGVLSPVSA